MYSPKGKRKSNFILTDSGNTIKHSMPVKREGDDNFFVTLKVDSPAINEDDMSKEKKNYIIKQI